MKLIYIAHPFGGEQKNVEKVEKIIKGLLHKHPDCTFYSLKEGDNVMCDTIKGRTPGVCICNSVEADDDSLEAIIALTGECKPLKKVLGVYQEFEQEIPF